MNKLNPINQETFNSLPENIKEDIKNALHAFNKCYIDYENGQYKVSVSYGLHTSYPKDFKSIGIAYVDDFYSIDERRENYQKEFGYPWRADSQWFENQRQAEIGKVFIR